MEGDYIAVIAQASALFAQGRMTEARGALLHAASMMEGHPERGRVLIWAEGLNATMKSRKVRAVMAELASPIRLPLE